MGSDKLMGSDKFEVTNLETLAARHRSRFQLIGNHVCKVAC